MKDTGLTEKEWEQIRAVLRAVPSIEKAVLFGSRAMGLARGNSDVDIMLYGEKLTMGDVAHARALLEETTLPYQFDLVLCDAENETLQGHVRQYGVVLFESKSFSHGNWDWEITTVGKITKFSNGKKPTFSDSGRYFVYGGNGAYGLSEKYNADAENIVIGRVGAYCGSLFFLKTPAWVSDNAIICKPLCNKLFMFYFLKNESLNKLAQGAAQPLLNQDILNLIEVTLPSVSEQQAIAQILSLLDDRIQLLRETNATLEAMAQALFKSWFVDFDPVHAKAEGRTPEDMDAETAALFPAEFEESELGMIPKGWRIETIGSSFKLTMGQSPPGDTYNDSGNGLPFFQGRTDFGIRYPENRKYCTEPTRIAQPNDTLISVRAPVGDINMAWEKCCIGRGVAAARHISGHISFTHYCLKSIQHKISAFDDSGTVFGSITKKQFENIIVLMPSGQVVSAFESFANVFDEIIKNNTAKMRTLTALRDTLLPRLISGKLRLPEFTEPTCEPTV